MPRPSTVIALLAGVLVLALLLRLGVWQLERARYKDALQARFEASEALAPQSPEDLLALPDRDAWHFRRARFSGSVLASRQYLLDNRTWQGRAGYHVLTVVRSPGFAVLVNRGWVPVGPDRSTPPAVEPAANGGGFTGRLVPPPRGGLLLGESGYERGPWPRVVQRVDLASMEADTGLTLLPAMLLLDPTHPDCYVCEWHAVPGVSAERHRGYAVQWFSLAAALIVIVVVVSLRSRPSRVR